jgi:5-methyltetrahydrofolate--homocysteine methyltransferase
MNEKLTLLDGAVGTSLWEKTANKVPVWRYNFEDPDIVRELLSEYAEAGSEIILANTFSANRPSMKGTGYTVEQIVTRAMEIAHETIDGKASIALAIGPLTGLLKPFGDITAEDAFDYFDEQITAGVKGNPDVIFLQTFIDLEMMKIAARAARKHDVPLFCTMSFAKSSPKKGPRTMMGNSVEDIVKGLEPFHVDGIGMNCSMGPETALPVIEEFSRQTDIPLIFKPNAGKPTLEGGSQFDYSVFAGEVSKAASVPGVKYIGGCCGSNAKYIKALKKKLAE